MAITPLFIGNLPPATFRIHPVRVNGTTHQRARRGGNLPPATFRIQPVRMNDTTPRHVIPSERKRVEESSRVASFILCWFFPQRGGFLHSAGAAVGMTYVSGLIVTDLNVQRFRLTPDGGRLPPLHCVAPFNHTGCIRNVAGGRLPPLHARRWVIPFNRTGCIRNVPGG